VYQSLFYLILYVLKDEKIEKKRINIGLLYGHCKIRAKVDKVEPCHILLVLVIFREIFNVLTAITSDK